jgi:hypothetical protein
MKTAQSLLGHVKTEPYRPFRNHRASGRPYDVRHPRMICVGRSNILGLSFVSKIRPT